MAGIIKTYGEPTMNKLSLLGVVYALVTVLFSTTTNAALVERDWKTSGDNLITYDPGTNLDWLELTASLGVSYNSMILEFGVGGQYEGFRYATQADILTLWGNAGTQATTGDMFGDPAGFAATQDLLTKLGIQRTDIKPTYTQYLTSAFYQGSDPTTSDTPIALLSWTDAFNPSYNNNIHAGTWVKSGSSSGIGSWLVRESSVVPIPGAVWLFGSGLIGLVGFARRGNRIRK